MSNVFFELNGYKNFTDSSFDTYISQPNGYIKNRFKRKATPEELRDALKDWFSDEPVNVYGFEVSNSFATGDVCWHSPILGREWMPRALLPMIDKFEKCEATKYIKTLFNGRKSVRIAEVVQAIKDFHQPKVTPVSKPTLKDFTDAVYNKTKPMTRISGNMYSVLKEMWPVQCEGHRFGTDWFAHYNWLIHNWNPPEKKVTYQVSSKVWKEINLLLDMQRNNNVLVDNMNKIIDLLVINNIVSLGEAGRMVRYAARRRGFMIAAEPIIIEGLPYKYDEVELKLV